MGLLKQRCSAEPTPPWLWALAGVLLSSMLLMFVAFIIEFQPAAWFAHAAWYGTSVIGIAVAGWLVFAVVSGRLKPHDMSKTMFVLLSPFMAALIVGFLWLVLVRGIAGPITGLTGTPTTLPPVIMHTDDSYHHRQCDPQLLGPSMHSFAQNHLCTSPAYFTAHPDHRVEIQLEGKQGLFGFYITGFKHLRDLGPYVRH